MTLTLAQILADIASLSAAERVFVLNRIITEQQYAELLNVSVATVRRRSRAGQSAPRYRVSERRHGYKLGEVIADLDTRREQLGSQANALRQAT
jgi:hypothetical protein